MSSSGTRGWPADQESPAVPPSILRRHKLRRQFRGRLRGLKVAGADARALLVIDERQDTDRIITLRRGTSNISDKINNRGNIIVQGIEFQLGADVFKTFAIDPGSWRWSVFGNSICAACSGVSPLMYCLDPDMLRDDAGGDAVQALHLSCHAGLPAPVIVAGTPCFTPFVSFWWAALQYRDCLIIALAIIRCAAARSQRCVSPDTSRKVGLWAFDISGADIETGRAGTSADGDLLLTFSGGGTIELNGVAPANFSPRFVL